jgi:hypothetical protein
MLRADRPTYLLRYSPAGGRWSSLLASGVAKGAPRRATMPGMAIPADQREALRMLAGSPHGSTESILLAHGFGIGTLHDLVRDGLVTTERRTVRAERRLIEVKLMTITDAGRRALAE